MTPSPFLLATIAVTFVLAGLVKGFAGMGLPTVAMGALGLVMAPAEAAALLIVPSFITNVWQFAAGPHRGRMVRRLWAMQLGVAAATCLATGLLTGSTATATALLGAALILYAVFGLVAVRLSVPARVEPVLSPVVGVATGIVTGFTGVFVLPAVPYLQALDFERDDLVQALGLSFTVSTVGLAAGLAIHGAFHMAAIGASLLCTVPAAVGMALGTVLRGRIGAALFRRLFFIGLALLGADLLLRSVG
jgi:uncharacterized membrane protein YfcA